MKRDTINTYTETTGRNQGREIDSIRLVSFPRGAFCREIRLSGVIWEAIHNLQTLVSLNPKKHS